MKVTQEPSSPCVTFLREQQSDCLHCAVRASALFADLRESDLDEGLKPIHNGLIKADSIIYEAGAPAEALFTIRSGLVKLMDTHSSARPRIVRLLGRGAAIGLESVEGGTYDHTAITLRDINLCRIPRSVLLYLDGTNSRLATGIVSKWREQALWSDRWISTICSGHLMYRVTSLIRLLAEISGDSLDALRLPRTSDMAEILGCSVEGLSRCTAEMKRSGLLERVAPWTYKCSPALMDYSKASAPSTD